MRASIEEGDSIVSCPYRLSLGYHSFLESSWFREIMSVGTLQSPSVIAFRLFLMEQYSLGVLSLWWPYISALPQPFSKDFNTPLFFDDQDTLWIEGTDVGSAAKLRASVWREEFEQTQRLAERPAGSEGERWTRFVNS